MELLSAISYPTQGHGIINVKYIISVNHLAPHILQEKFPSGFPKNGEIECLHEYKQLLWDQHVGSAKTTQKNIVQLTEKNYYAKVHLQALQGSLHSALKGSVHTMQKEFENRAFSLKTHPHYAGGVKEFHMYLPGFVRYLLEFEFH